MEGENMKHVPYSYLAGSTWCKACHAKLTPSSLFPFEEHFDRRDEECPLEGEPHAKALKDWDNKRAAEKAEAHATYLRETPGVTAHELARLLLTLPDLPVATYALDRTYMSNVDRKSHGPLRVGRLENYENRPCIIIGNLSKRNINRPNWYVSKMYLGEAPEE
jgi:hypothetical protein